MEYRRLGRTGLEISALALGTMQWGWTTDEETAYAMTDVFIERGLPQWCSRFLHAGEPSHSERMRTSVSSSAVKRRGFPFMLLAAWALSTSTGKSRSEIP